MSDEGAKQDGTDSPTNFPPGSHPNNNSSNPQHGSPSVSRPGSTMPPEGQSVVSKLMQIYESMTQSSTPQNEDFPMDDSHHHEHHQQQQHEHQHSLSEHDIPFPYSDHAAYAFMPPDPNFYTGQPSSNTISTSYHHQQHQDEAQMQMQDNSFAQPEVPESNETAVTSSTRSLRKRTIDKAAAASSDTSINSSSGGGGGRSSKSRKKAKETDNRWSKRFTWPDDLHRDFVSAIFDVGLKHSSPSAILEQMPKHEQITSERVKSHLQKYRLHRNKSKKEFMASYDSAFKGDNAGDITGSSQEDQQGQQQQQQDEQGQQDGQQLPQQQQEADGNTTDATGANGSTTNPNNPTQNGATNPNEALMLPQLSEGEKRSPIGVSMGYLMGLFFSLKDQLMAQRAAAAAAAAAAAEAVASPELMPVSNVFDAFGQGVDGAATEAAASAAAGWMNVSDASQQLVSFASQAAHIHPGDGSMGVAAAAAAAAASGPSCRSNLEESTLMKREMQHQMAFQNKMRALKQHELEKYKNSSLAMTFDTDHTNKAGEGVYKSDDDGSGMPGGGMGGEMGHPDSQGAGETAMDPSIMGAIGDANNRQPQRNRGLSVGGSDEFWTSDVVDDQLFEFLMNN